MSPVSKLSYAPVLLVVAFAMAGAAPPAPGSAMVPQGGMEIPFELGPRGHILIDVAIDGNDPVQFVLDTGAGRTVVNQTRLDALGLEERMSGDSIQGAHGRSAMGLSTVESLSLGGADMGRLELGTMDLTEIEAGEMTLFGVLGFDILSRFDVILDFVDRTVVFHPRAGSLEACMVCQGSITVPFTLAVGTHIQLEVSISDEPMAAILDTGSGRTGMNRNAAQAIGIDLPPATPGRHAPALQVGELHLGTGVLARDVVVGVVDLPVFTALGVADGPAILLGTGALAGRRVGISYGLGRLSIQ